MSHAPKLLDSVVAVFTHQDSVFAIQRQPYLHDFPGYHSFPGGKVDQDESEEVFSTPFLCEHEARWMRALCRELKEEINFDLENAILSQHVQSLKELGVAITPPFSPKRFNTRFFQIELNETIDFDVDDKEAIHSGWQPHQRFLQDYEQGKVLAILPTLKVMQALAEKSQSDTPLPPKVFHLEYDTDHEVPVLSTLNGVDQLLVKSNTLPPAKYTNAYVIGDEPARHILIDPAPSSPEEYQKLKDTLGSYRIDAILLTHHHFDHHERADVLAKDLKVPILISRDSYERLCHKWGQTYFNSIEIEFLKEGDVLTQWLGKDVLVYEIPGHDAGHLGLAPQSMEWFLVGDLIQGVGTVVISAPEGHMGQYFKTMERVIAFDPHIILPSHGLPMWSTYRLRKTLEHRQMREEQILQLYQAGSSKDAILEEVYRGLDSRLFPLAMRNIEAHLLKLQEEQRIDPLTPAL